MIYRALLAIAFLISKNGLKTSYNNAVSSFIFKEDPESRPNHIYIVGQTEYQVVVVDDVKYTVPSLMKAVDILFKTCFELNLPFPKKATHIFTFIQKYIYQINTKNDYTCDDLNSLLQQLMNNK